MTPHRKVLLVSVLLGGSTFVVLVATSGDYGVTWDEAFPQFPNALLQAEWLQKLGEIGNPFSEKNVDTYWDTTQRYPNVQRSDHPSLPKTVMAVSYVALRGVLGTIRALRLPNNLYFSLLAGILCYWMSRKYSLIEGIGASLALVTMPRVFGHAHVAGLDLPILVLWVLCALAYFEAVERPSWRRYMLCGLVYGISACFKLHAFFFPLGFFLWGLWEFVSSPRKKASPEAEARTPPAWEFWRPHLYSLVCMAALAVVLYFLTQPFLWHHTWQRLSERFSHYAGKASTAPIALYYLGNTYRGVTPWHYPLVMTLLTVPLAILLLTLIGIATAVRSRSDGFGKLCLVSWLASISLVLLPLAQAYDGVRLFLASFGFLAIFAGKGLGCLASSMGKFLSLRRLPRWIQSRSGVVLFLLFFGPATYVLASLHPFQLEYYSGVIGGIPGAHKTGMESTYWCNALTPEFLDTLNRRLPDRSNIRPLCMSYEVLHFYRDHGLLNSTFAIDEHGRPKDFHLLQCRQGMMGSPRDTFTITGWGFYLGRYGPPRAVIEKEGVPLFMLFGPLPGAK